MPSASVGTAKRAGTRACAGPLSWTRCSRPSHNDASNTPEQAYAHILVYGASLTPCCCGDRDRTTSYRLLERAFSPAPAPGGRRSARMALHNQLQPVLADQRSQKRRLTH